MNSEITYGIIKRTILSFLPDSRILLFGSHARGNTNKDSDYDLFVITPGIFTKKEKLSWTSRIHKAIVNAIHAPIDLLLYSEDEVLEKQELPGHIVRCAIKEGIAL